METQVYHILHLDEVESTQKYSIDNIDKFSHGQVILADCQTAGHGRLNRPWISHNRENLYMSILLKPDSREIETLPLAGLSQLISLSICKILTDHHWLKNLKNRDLNPPAIKPVIKWPNDVLINHKKISGVISKVIFQGDEFKGIVLGVGLNINLNEDDRKNIGQPATSLKEETGQNIDKNHMAELILEEFFQAYPLFIEKGFSYIKEDYMNFFPFIGQKIEINNLAGRIKNISNAGSLILEDFSGKNINITMGDMQCL